MREFLKSTLVGGVVFLLPLVLLLLMLGYALQAVSGIAGPVLSALDLEHYGTVSGIGLVTAVSAAILVAVAFAAGVIARTAAGSRLTQWLETSVLGRLPQYQMLKSMAGSFAKLQSTAGLTPALAAVEGGWQIGYRLEMLENGWEVVFVPQAPATMTGTIMYMPPERVKPLDLTMAAATSLVQQMGLGSRAALAGVDMGPR